MKAPVTILAAALFCNAAIGHEHGNIEWETVWQCDGLTLYSGKIDPEANIGPGYIDLHGLRQQRAKFAMAGLVPAWHWRMHNGTPQLLLMKSTALGWEANYYIDPADSLDLSVPDMTFYGCFSKR